MEEEYYLYLFRNIRFYVYGFNDTPCIDIDICSYFHN